ncbi:MAG: formate dehydrogenase subunit alpha [Spirochaetaceae bacterium]|nr:MAG: formate dehydrogenase subunit alpha [Spirochaetaceae bacterium]
MVRLKIDGRELETAQGNTILDAALEAGIDIPRLCAHPELTPSGGCRLCMVEVSGIQGMQTSCTLEARDGMEVVTVTEEIENHRKITLDGFISDHPLDCVTCDKAGACELQELAYRYDLKETSMHFELGRTLFQDDNPAFLRDHKYCILCGRCVRACSEVVGADALEYADRGFESHIATAFDRPMEESPCVFCGSCVEVCPTAALMTKSRLRKGREWELGKVRSVCTYCGVGCQMEYRTRQVLDAQGKSKTEIVSVNGFPEAPANGVFLCTKGRYGWDYIAKPDRLDMPLIRKDLAFELGITREAWELPGDSPLKVKDARDNFVPVSWDQALDVVADRLAKTVKENGPDSVGGLASARCSNEDNYTFQKLMRSEFGTNNVDHCARLCHASTVAGLAKAFGSGAMTNSIGEVRHADCIFITGSNTSEAHPVIGYEVTRALRKGASLIVVDPRRIPLARKATIHLQAKSGTDIWVFQGMMRVIRDEKLADEEFIKTRTEGFELFASGLEDVTVEEAARVAGVDAEDIRRAARIYAGGIRQEGVSKYGEGRGRSTILYSMGITQRSNGTELVLTLANLAMMCGMIGKESSGVNPLRGQGNVQGACDLGALPNVLPGYQAVTDDALRTTVEKKWGGATIPNKPGLTIVEMMRAAESGDIKAMFIMGENPMISDPNITHVEHSLRTLPFLVVADIFLTETAQLAHVVLPARAALEKVGTFTNTERRVQLSRQVVAAPGEAREDWRIVSEIGKRVAKILGHTDTRWDFRDSADVAEEISLVSPIYGGIVHERLPGDGLNWPCPDKNHPGTPILHVGQFKRGKGAFTPVTPKGPAEMPDEEYPFYLGTGRMLYHYHTGTMSRRTEVLHWKQPKAYVEIHEDDAAEMGIADGKPVVVESRRGSIRAAARVGTTVQRGMVFIPFHFREAAANLLTQDENLDPTAKIPELKVCAVKVTNPAAKKKVAVAS